MKALSTRRKVFLLTAMLLAGSMASAQVRIKGNVYGGGEGTREDEKHGLVTGNTSVTMNGGTVEQSIYGGGEFGSVGTFTNTTPVVYNAGGEDELTVKVPSVCQPNTGLAKVVLNGGQVGIPDHALMPTPGTTTWDDANGYIFAGSRGEADSISYPKAIALAVVDSTYLEINDVVIAASIYGGCEHGLVLRNTYVKVKGGQIGIGHYKDQEGGDHIVPAYSLDQWNTAIAKVKAETFTDSDANGFYDCDAWPYGRLNSETHLKDYLVYDPFAHPDSAYYNQAVALGGSLYASDGSSFFGNVFGGGSGYYPIAPGVWRRTAGQVNGNTQIDIEGGHILTAVYGGNELTDVIQKATINMTGGTVGIPRVFDSIAANPMNGHIFASGKGDMRTLFNRWTNVGSTEVNISGGVVFGSVYGGGEDGHVLGDVALNITENNADTRPVIGTFGTSTFDGNVFGSGRGFLGNAYTAGSVGGNVEMNITGGKVLGDVYGGGRLASVGSYFVDPQMVDPETGTLIDNPNYGQLQNGTNHGYVTINIHGVTLGNSRESDIGGNVYGGSMGRLTDLNHQINDMWPDLAKVKETTVNIGNSDATTVIKGNVFGGGEIGTVTQNTTVNLTPNSTTEGTVYGGGLGYCATQTDINSDARYGNTVKAGQVYGNTLVNMTGGVVENSIYGGGEMASVGTFEYYTPENVTGVHFVGEPKTCAENTGLAKVLISGGQAGLVDHATMPDLGTGTWDDDNGFVFCGSRGEADTITYPKAHLLAIVDTTYLEISGDAIIAASVYGGSENGMVIHDTHVKIKGGQIGVGYDATTTPPSFFSSYTAEQWNAAINAIRTGVMTDALAAPFHPCDAWAYGNGINSETGYPNGPFYVYDPFADPDENPTYTNQALAEGAALVAKDGNSFFGKVYGGGSGYYPIAPGVWRRSAGRVNGNTLVDIEGGHILTAVYGGNETTDVLSKATINMSGGTVGIPRTFDDIVATPTVGHIFGSGLGDTRTRFNKWTNVNETEINITGGTVFGSVFGGGADGHVLEDTKVTVDGENALIGTYGHTLFDGNVFGGGRGFSGNALTAGAVCGNTEVNIVDGQVLGSVYGGGRLASVGLDLIAPDDEGYGVLQDGTDHGFTTVNITGGTIGAVGNYENNVAIGDHRVSGNVYGGSKGRLTQMDYTTLNPRWPSLAKVKQTEVNIDGSGVVIKGDVFGGGEYGTVRDSTQAIVSNGMLMRDLFGGGYGSTSTATVSGCDSTNMTPVMIAGRVYGRTNATVNGGTVKHNVYGGGEYAKVGFQVKGQSTVDLNGGIIGSHVPGVTVADTLFGGMVYGGGLGILADTTVAMVLGDTYIYDTLSNNNTPAHVLGHIYGGGEKALVQQHTNLTLGSLEVGTLADATETVTKTLPNGSSVTLYQTRALEGGRVFGGGQGVEDEDKRNVALVMGNTNTEVTGTAKVYGSVYGGGELANVGSGTLDNNKNTGSATVTISGGTIGPLNGSQRNGNVFGGGKGLEEMTTLNDVYYATVDSTHVVIKAGANIAGSVFGGGANGRVLGNTSTDIQGGTIGTTGLTTWDGNVFGAGRNYNAYANTTGAVFGNVDIQMSDGTIKANMYGGGRFGSVGMNYNDEHEIDTIFGKDHGYVNINMTGGVVGTDYVQYLGHYANGSDMPRTGFVFGGGHGIMETDKIEKLGNVKGTTVTVGGDALVKSSVYGGSERGIIYKNTLVKMTGNAQVGEASETMANHRGDVYGGGCGYDTIAQGGTYVFMPEAGSVKGNTRVEMDGSNVYGNIYGACRLTDVLGHASVIISGGEVGWQRTPDQISAKPLFGYVYAAGRGEVQERLKTWTTVGSTYVEVNKNQNRGSDPRIWGCVFGGGEEGHVNRNTHVVVKGGTIGTTGTTGTDGNVFGGGRGKNPIITGKGAAAVSGNTQVDIQDGCMYGSVYGGGNRGSVGVYFIETTVNGHTYQPGDPITGTNHGYTLVNVSGGQIGHEDSNGRTGGNVYGGCRGMVANPDINPLPSQMSHVKQTEVNIFESDTTETFIMGSVFGGGEDGHVFKDTYVNISDGQIGGSTYNPSSPTLCSDLFHGNVYGGGRGLDTYVDDQGVNQYSPTAGKVEGNTHVMITGGRVCRNVYGGGNMSSVGDPDDDDTGLAKVTVTGGTIGVNPVETNLNGMVFGSGHGKAGEAYKDLAMVKNTEVLITGNAQVKGSVFGSGEDGHTRKRTNVRVGDYGDYTSDGLVIGTSGTSGIDGNVYGGGRGYDTDTLGNYSSTAGVVGISTTTLINNGTVKGSVYGGGNLASVGYEDLLDTNASLPDDFGKATVTVTGHAIIGNDVLEVENGNVFGSGKGRMVEQGGVQTFADLSYVHETEVLVSGNAKVWGSVFGGGEDGHVRAYTITGNTTPVKPGNTWVTINGDAVIGDATELTSAMKGNVYGGGRGLDKDHQGNTSPTAGVVEGNTKVDILNGTIWRSVFGGGNQSVVKGQRVTNVVNGLIHADVHGGSNAIPSNDVAWAHGGLKTVNIRGGHVKGNVYGCSHSSNDGEVEQSQANAEKWTSFVNINGGTIDGSVYGAGYAGLVNGSVCVNIGKDAIRNAPNHDYNVNYNKPHNGNWDQTGTVEPTAAMLVIGGSVYGGSDYYGSTTTNDWRHYDQTGYSLIFIDGTDYNTTDNTGNYMNIGGGLFGSGTHTESGALGRHILLRNYGTRSERSGEMTSATRTLTTIQRVNNLVIDHANVNLSGLTDISSTTDTTRYAVMRVKDTLAVINASALVLKGTEDHPVVYMDSIHMVRSMKLASSTASIYNHNHNLNQLNKHSWYWLGVKDQSNDAKLYYINGTELVSTTPLNYNEENVLLFNDKSKLWVRYTKSATNYYGELMGFFRMRANAYDPYDITESFAYARPKTASFPGVADDNVSDGGFLCYNTEYNYFTDRGAQYTKTEQYPYRHPYLGYRVDHPNQEYRLWVDIPKHDTIWYVDGTRGWGRDDKSKTEGSGLYPDKPKKTIFGPKTYDEQTNPEGNYGGIITEVFGPESPKRYLDFSYKHDVIYVVGALSAEDEIQIADQTLHDSISDGVHHSKYPLRLFRYPGGHEMSNGKVDYGGGADSDGTTPSSWGNPNGNYTVNGGPGANYGAMLNVQPEKSIEVQGVVMDGLSNYKPYDVEHHHINTAEGLPEASKFDTAKVTLPMVVTHDGSTLSLSDSTVLKRGFNGTNAKNWYTDAFYNVSTVGVQGGAVYVDEGATVNVKGEVYVKDNKQALQLGDATTKKAIESNVFLPTFTKSLTINGSLDKDTRIGVTSPRGNNEATYVDNTLSPVADASSLTGGDNVANDAWEYCNFYDDLDWFFVSGHNLGTNGPRTTYYDPNATSKAINNRTLYFGWTWANIVRTKPQDFSYTYIDSPHDLAWLISLSAGMNEQTASNLDVDIKMTDDIDLIQYVWVPVGDSISQSTARKPFAGRFDGKGHLIKNLSIEYIGRGDKIYERNNYGLFGYNHKGSVDRTFVVSGTLKPANTDDLYMGGLVGCMDKSTITNSEAAVDIWYPNQEGAVYNVLAGGLVAKMDDANSMVHSSMAMPHVRNMGLYSAGLVGGLVGEASAGAIQNSFVNAKFSYWSEEQSSDVLMIGGLLGNNTAAKLENCYVAVRDASNSNLTATNFGSIAVSNPEANTGNINSCYVMDEIDPDVDFDMVLTGSCAASCGEYAPVSSADMLGYMCNDNRVTTSITGNANSDSTMFYMLDRWAKGSSTSDLQYARWARPGLQEINGDLPVLLLCDMDGGKHQGKFRSLATYDGGPVLQYGGPVRDDNTNVVSYTSPQLDGAINRLEANNALFVYGDITVAPTETPASKTKISIHEDASILAVGTLSAYDSTYVGITFDNSFRHAYSTPTINLGLFGWGGFLLPRDWHMFSTPLKDAPLGFNYMFNGVNTNEQASSNGVNFYSNPWESLDDEFNWLQPSGATNNYTRYWMYGWDNSLSQQTQTLNTDTWKDGYFPSQSKTFGEGWISGTDEYNRYPYGMDFYTWNEPKYHWINFKRNGPNHWHSDEPHVNLIYEPVAGATPNQNEDDLIVGRGYMGAIATQTFLQSHGTLNGGSAKGDSIILTKVGKNLTGWNLVGNPYHGYIDFDKLALDVSNKDAFYKETEGDAQFYVVYDADMYTPGDAGSGFRYYPKGSSNGGAYAGQFLHPHQGFYVMAKSDNVTLNFKESMLVARNVLGDGQENDGHFRNDDWRPNYPLVNLFLSSDHGCNDVTVVELDRPEWGGARKMKDLCVGNGVFYARHGESNYAALYAQKGVDRIPLWFDPHEDDIFTIKWNTANGIFHSMYLIDNITGVEYDMLKNDSYTFEGHTEDYPARFYIVFSLTDIEEFDDDSHHPFAFFDGTQWMVTGDGDLEFIDLLGRVLAERHISGQTRINLPEVACGTYLFRLTNNRETKIQKIIINRK